MTKLYTSLLGFFALIVVPGNAVAKNLSAVIPPSYIKEVSPGADDATRKPIEVQIAIYITDVSSVNTKDMDLRLDLLFRQTWQDDRLLPENAMNPGENQTVLSTSFLDKIWKPDPIILNSKKTDLAEMGSKFGSVVLSLDKKIIYTSKLAVLLGCQMDFRQFPNDLQLCPMNIESFSAPATEIFLRWETFDCETAGDRYTNVNGQCKGVGIIDDLKMLQFNLITPIPFTKEESHRMLGKQVVSYSRLVMKFQFERVLTQYIVQTFLPSFFIICLAWFSFFMGLDSVPGRVTLLVTSQLTLVTMFASSLSAAIPPVAYLKAIDYWMLYCLFFLFLAQIEFVVVKVLDVLYRYERTGSYYNNPGAANSKPLKKKRPKDESASSSLQSSSSSTSGAFKGLAGIFRRTNTTGAWSVDHEARKQHQEEIKLQLEQENGDTDYQDQRGFCNLHLGWIDEKGRERLLWREIDIAFRFIFPILFGIFNLVFWPMLYKRHF